MPKCCQLSHLFKYADDCTASIVFDQRDRLKAVADLNADLKRVVRWDRRWKTTFEPTKTHAMFVTNTRDQGCHPMVDLLEFDGVKIGYEESLKIVGVLYDAKMTFKPMVEEMVSRGRSALGLLKKLTRLLSDSDLGTIYKYFVRSKMEYGNASYRAAGVSYLEKLDAIQHRAEKLSGTCFQPLAARRDAACFGLLC